jgi:hypothetical protein
MNELTCPSTLGEADGGKTKGAKSHGVMLLNPVTLRSPEKEVSRVRDQSRRSTAYLSQLREWASG